MTSVQTAVPVELIETKAKYEQERLKRLRSEGIRQYTEIAGDLVRYRYDPFVEPGFTRDPISDEMEVIIIGGGFGGICAGARLRDQGFEKIRIIDDGGDFGGTWYWNRYPGCMCDVESYVYMPMLEELGYMPTRRYASSAEIRNHAQAIARKYGLYENACFQTRVTGVHWDQGAERWHVNTEWGDDLVARYVVIANGPLNKAKLPGIPGIEKFKGHSFHTSRWDYRYTGGDDVTEEMVNLQDKRVGIIGTGATALQAIPALGKWSKQLYVFQRTPSAIDVRNNADTDADWYRSQKPGWQKVRVENFTAVVAGNETDEDFVNDGWTELSWRLTRLAVSRKEAELGRKLTREERTALLEEADFEVMERIRARVDDVIEDPDTAKALKPWYKRWCKRPTFHDEYLPTFNRPNVKLVDTDGQGVDEVTEKGIIVKGVEYELDCLIFATGFEAGTVYTSRTGYDVIGRNGKSLSEKWAEGFKTFHGMQAHDYPNMFVLGPTQTGANVNFAHAITEQAGHLAYILGEAKRRGTGVIEATQEAEDEWVEEIRRTQRAGLDYFKDCTPSYLTNEGSLEEYTKLGLRAGTYGGGATKFFQLMDAWRSQGDMEGLELKPFSND